MKGEAAIDVKDLEAKTLCEVTTRDGWRDLSLGKAMGNLEKCRKIPLINYKWRLHGGKSGKM